MKKFIYILLAIILIFLFVNRVKVKDVYLENAREELPIAVNIGDVNIQMIDDIPLEYNLDVPFISQAPYANWDLPYQEACEEAAIIMVHYYLENKEINIELADKEILDLVLWQENNLGDYKDTTVDETVNIVKDYWGYDFEVIPNPSVEVIKKYIANGHPVVAPFYGKVLSNPYYSGDGPLYHMMVIKGYTQDKFITNDPGTKRGEDYMYDYDILMSAMHDWNNGDVENGLPIAFIIK
ncbi:MAG: C39 family peptidase [Candidatus Komeilibacteria bacterium]